MSLHTAFNHDLDFFTKPIDVEVSDAPLTSDAGLLLMRQFDHRIGFTQQFGDALHDPRHPQRIEHSFLDMTRMRIFGILAGYEDQNDHDTLRTDPIFKLLSDRSPEDDDLASQPTLSRFENLIDIPSLLRLRDVFIDQFIASFAEPPVTLTFDLDAVDDPTHGNQQLTLFHGYYEQYQYLPLVITCEQTDDIVMLSLRHGTATASLGADDDLEYLITRLRAVWPNVRIRVRGDCGFGVPLMHELCDRLDVIYTFGQSANAVLQRESEELLAEAVRRWDETNEPQRLFMGFWYRAQTWVRPRWVIAKCEAHAAGTNRRFVTTNRPDGEAYLEAAYDEYAMRGESENRNKEFKCGMAMDRLSDHRFMANYFRLYLHAAALNLVSRLRRPGDPFFFICFRSADGRRLERSTKESSRKRAEDAAPALIKEEYEPQSVVLAVTWDEAVVAIKRRMRENNNKSRTIEDYADTLRIIQRLFPNTRGPGDITPALAKEFRSLYQREYTRKKPQPVKVWKGRGRKPKPPSTPTTYNRKARTIASRLNKLRVIWSKWLIEDLSYLTDNPWEEVVPPKLDRLAPRYLSGEEVRDVFVWLSGRWSGWRLPVLFFTVEGFLGNRIGELSALRTEQLREGRVVFAADTTKGRKERKAVLPPDVFAELQAQAGPVWVWEDFPRQLRERLDAQERLSRNVNPEFSPNRLKWWLQDELADFNAAHPDRQRIKAHDFRRRAMTEAWKLGIPLEKAAVAFGCNPNTMRAHYIALDETAVADEVLRAIAGTMRTPTTSESSDVPKAG